MAAGENGQAGPVMGIQVFFAESIDFFLILFKGFPFFFTKVCFFHIRLVLGEQVFKRERDLLFCQVALVSIQVEGCREESVAFELARLAICSRQVSFI